MKLIANKTTLSVIAAFVFSVAAALSPLVPQAMAAPATGCDTGAAGGIKSGLDCANNSTAPDTLFGSNSIFTNIVNTLLFVIGSVSVIMLIWGGIRYSTSAGNASNVTAAKNTIMYAIIGLIIAFLAYAIVNWVLVALAPNA